MLVITFHQHCLWQCKKLHTIKKKKKMPYIQGSAFNTWRTPVKITGPNILLTNTRSILWMQTHYNLHTRYYISCIRLTLVAVITTSLLLCLPTTDSICCSWKLEVLTDITSAGLLQKNTVIYLASGQRKFLMRCSYYNYYWEFSWKSQFLKPSFFFETFQ